MTPLYGRISARIGPGADTWFRDRPDIARLGRGFGISQATAYRYLDEAIAVLSARAPGLREALEQAKEQGLPQLILNGKVVAPAG